MQFLYSQEAKQEFIELKDERFKYLIKVRRHKQNSILHVRNLKDENLYRYTIQKVGRNSATLRLVNFTKSVKGAFDFSLAWAVVDPKTIQKSLCTLNQMGVKSIDFVYTKFSQKNFKLDFDKFKRILINSCEQCGRSEMMEFKVYDNLERFLNQNPQVYVLDFNGENFSNNTHIKKVLVGCEGGFTQEEKMMFNPDQILGLKSDLILTSQSAVYAVTAKILL